MSIPGSLVLALADTIAEAGSAPALTERVRRTLLEVGPHELPEEVSAAQEDTYARYVLYREPNGLFSIISVALAFGQSTPIHDHSTWGVVTVLAGRQREVHYRATRAGGLCEASVDFNEEGSVSVNLPPLDVHRVEGACPRGGVTVSLHVYGGDADRILCATYEAPRARRSTEYFVRG